MAIARGAGTEIIRCASFEDIDSTSQTIIVGEQHHIYTMLSMVVYCVSLNAVTDSFSMYFFGYDAKGGTTDSAHLLLNTVINAGDTFVWDNKFSFNGHEPVDFTGPMNDVTKQNAIADQGSSVAQYMTIQSTHASDNYEVLVTYIDQNNA